MKARLRVLAVLLGACGVAFAPLAWAVAHGWWPFSDDALPLFDAWRGFARSSLRAGALPLWNPHLLLGLPLLANSQTGVLYPPNAIYWLPPPWAMLLDGFFHALLLGCGGYALCRALRLGRAASLLGALCLMLGGPVSAHLGNGHLTWNAARAFVPWELWALLRGLQSGERRFGVWLGLFAAGSFAAGYPPVALLGLALCAGMLVAWALTRRPSERQIAAGFLAWGLATALVLAALLGAMFVLPLAEASRASVHGSGLQWHLATDFSASPRTVARLVLPGFWGNNRALAWGSALPHEEVGYIGALPLLLALFAPWLARRPDGKLPRAVPWLWALLPLAALLALGRHTPFYGWVWRVVPPLRATRVPVRWLELWYLAASLLAAFSFDALQLRAVLVQNAPRERLLRAMLGLLLCGCGAALLWTAFTPATSGFWMRAAQTAAARAGVSIRGVAATLRRTALGECGFALLWAACALAALRRCRARSLMMALLVLVACDLGALFWRSARPVSPAAQQGFRWPTILAHRYVRGERWDTAVAGNAMNDALRWRADVWGGYDALLGTRYFAFAQGMEGPLRWGAGYQGLRRGPLLRVAGVSHVLQNAPNSDLDRLKSASQLRLVAAANGWKLWRLSGPRWMPWPRAYLSRDVRRVPAEAQLATLNALAQQSWKVPPVVTAPGAFARVRASVVQPGEGVQWQRGANRFAVRCHAAAPSVLVISEANAAGWRGFVNGRATRVETVNFMMRGVEVPRGTSRVTLVYEPQVLRFAGFLTLCGVALLCGIVVANLNAGAKKPGHR